MFYARSSSFSAFSPARQFRPSAFSCATTLIHEWITSVFRLQYQEACVRKVSYVSLSEITDCTLIGFGRTHLTFDNWLFRQCQVFRLPSTLKAMMRRASISYIAASAQSGELLSCVGSRTVVHSYRLICDVDTCTAPPPDSLGFNNLFFH